MRETLRVWTENLETFVLEVILEERPGKRAAIVRFLLALLSKVFALAVKVRRFLYNVRLLRDSTLGVQVIAIGNLTVGGTGKTPVVEKFARELQSQGRTVAILSRGYRSKPPPLHHRLIDKLFFREDTTPPRVVSDGKSQNAYRCHVRPPSFVNLQALPAMAKGHLVSDLVALIGTIDIVLGEVDR